MTNEHVDVLIVGAGLSGIGAACHLSRECPDKTYLIVERRQAIGGTWDLFRYPGVRSDSDMFTFGYKFRPWNATRTLADGPSIKAYVEATADEYHVRDRIRFGLKIVRASWSGRAGVWTVEAADEATGESRTFTAGVLLACTGYYDYDSGYRPKFAGEEQFGGRLIHPQHWPEDLDYAGKKVLIIGSGATAVTLVPSMSDTAAHVTMLQRSPTYILSLPGVDGATERLKKVLPDSVASRIARGRNIVMQRTMYAIARARPGIVKAMVRKGAERSLNGASDMKHFTPSYEPWDQRLCIVPDGDLFKAIRSGRADIVTDTIDTFTETGVRLSSGTELTADIVITATGLNVQMLGGAELVVDGEPVVLRDHVTYKGVLLDGVPNAALVFGYTNASWTLKADLAAEYVCRLLNHMDAKGYTRFVARATESDRDTGSVLGALNSGYVKRGDALLPRQGKAGVWRVRNDYLRDAPMLRYAGIDDDVLQFSREPKGSTVRA